MFRHFAVPAVFLALAFPGAVLAHSFTHGDIRVMHPWAVVAAEGKSSPVYMTLTNAGAEADKLVAVEAKAAERTEIQKAKKGSGATSYEAVSTVSLGAKKTLAMQPGGLRILLIGLKEPLRHEYTLPLTLVFERAGRVDIQAVIQKSAAEGHTH